MGELRKLPTFSGSTFAPDITEYGAGIEAGCPDCGFYVYVADYMEAIWWFEGHKKVGFCKPNRR